MATTTTITPVATAAYKWTPASDRTLLLFALGRQLVSADFRMIAVMLPGTPTRAKVRARLVILRARQLVVVAATSLTAPSTTIPAV
ncbi:hypothetical protein LTR09_006376 [Extremus antarcticus]|uniref:Uncharacterized protein n=1 Tax=Extremus antarcticus TaxID=702011 RepID=A0AAJ0DEK5_9PEZI|nr:hypothetical protein LTR09_006376 [Extremus antarcticus]